MTTQLSLGINGVAEDRNAMVPPAVLNSARRAKRWTETNAGLWYEMVERARRFEASGTWCSVRDDIEVPTLKGTGIRSVHANTAAFARMLCDEVPGFESVIRMTDSQYDDVEWEEL